MNKLIKLLGVLLVMWKLSPTPIFAHTEYQVATDDRPLVGLVSPAPEVPDGITEEQARSLVSDALYGVNGPINRTNFDYQGPASEISPGFFAYQWMGAGGDALDFMTVNPRTGDVWSLFKCKKVSTSQSRRLQAAIKKRLSIEQLKQYKLISMKKPECIVE